MNEIQFFNTLFSPLGGHAPRCRRFMIDYKDAHGRDMNMDVLAAIPRDMTDAQTVKIFQQQYDRGGGKLSAVCEVLPDGSGNCLYFALEALKESIAELGLPIPRDLRAHMDAAGLHPINYDELVKEACAI
ncbi:MAG: hypothetical protein IJ649_08310 [Oscillospiraceae bacterium]|nr:hypothetical protein [Oscillospiraceae bacterium]